MRDVVQLSAGSRSNDCQSVVDDFCRHAVRLKGEAVNLSDLSAEFFEDLEQSIRDAWKGTKTESQVIKVRLRWLETLRRFVDRVNRERDELSEWIQFHEVDPTPEEIAAACAKINARWSDEERQERKGTQRRVATGDRHL